MMHPFLLIREFGANNLQSLFKGAPRPRFIAIVCLIIEHFLLFSLILIPDFVSPSNNNDSNNNTNNSSLEWVSLHMISDSAIQPIVIGFLIFNSAIYAIIAGLFLFYCISPYKQKTLMILSFCVMNYNNVISIPSFFISLNKLTIFSSVNIVLTITLSLISAFLSSKCYNFILTDYLAKRGSIWDIIKVIVLDVSLIGIRISENDKPYVFFIMGFAVVNGLNLLNKHLFHDQIISITYLSLNMGLVMASIIASSSQNTDSKITFIFAIICILPFALKLSIHMIETLHRKIISSIDSLCEGNQLKLSGADDELRNESDFLIDYYTRHLIGNYQLFKRERMLFGDYFHNLVGYKSSQDENDLYIPGASIQSKEHSTSFNLGLFIQNQEITSFNSMKEKIRDLMEKLEGNKYAVSSEKLSIAKQESNTLRYLFYLLEIEQNLPKVAIKLHEYLYFMKNHIGIIEQSILKMVKHELELKEQEILRIETDLTGAFLFEENLTSARSQLLQGHRQKIEFLKELSNDVINIEEMKEIGVKFVKQRDNIALQLLMINQTNHKNPELNHLLQLFYENLWMDERDKKCTLLSLGRNGSGKPRGWGKMIRKIKKLDYEAMSNKSCTILASLSLDRLGRIIKVSKNSDKIIGFSSFDLIGKNCNILQPHSISVSHNKIIKQGIERKIQRHYNKSYSPIIARKKDGYGVRMSLEFQVLALTQVNSDIGLVVKLKIAENEFEKYILADVINGGCETELCSKSIFNSLLFRYFKSADDFEGIELHQIFPSLMGLSNHMKNAGMRKMKFKTLGFLPVQKVNLELRQKRLRDSQMNLPNSIKQQYFNISWNDVYLVDLSVRFFIRQGAFEVLLVKMKNVDIVQDENQIPNIIRNLFFPHLIERKLISEITPQLLDDFLKDDDTSSHYSAKLPRQLEAKYEQKTDITLFTSEQQVFESKINNLPQIFQSNFENSGLSTKGLSKLDNIVKEIPSTRKVSKADGYKQRLRNNSHVIQDDSQNSLNHSPKIPSETDLELTNSKRFSISNNTQNEFQMTQRNPLLREDYTKSQMSKLSQVTQQQHQAVTPSNLLLKITQEDSKQFFSSQEFVSPKAKEDHVTFQVENLSNGILSIENLQKINQKSSSKKVQEQSDSLEKDRNKEFKHDQFERQTNRGSISSQPTSQSETLRAAVRQKIEDQKQKGLLNFVLFVITLAFIGMLVLIGVTYGLLHSKLQKQELAFTFSWWQDIVSNNIISILRLDEIKSVINLNAFSFSSDPDTIAFEETIGTLINTLYDEYMDQLISVCSQDLNDLYLVDQLYTLKTNYTQFNVVTMAQKNITFSMLQAFKVASYSTLQITQMGQGMKQLTFIELMSNVYNLQDNLALLVIKLKIDQQNLIDEMNLLVEMTLIIIILISSLIGLIIIPFYSYFQSKKEFVLRLFASLEPTSVKEMYDILLESIQILTKMQKNEMQDTRENIKLKESSRTGRIKDNNNDQYYFITKKKKNVPTTSLPKFSLKLCFQIIIVTLAINVQPIVNVILTSEQISKQETEQSIIKGLFSLETTLLNTQFAGYTYTNKFINPYSNYLTTEYLALFLQSTLSQIAVIINPFSETLFNFSNQSASSTSQASTFISTLISSDICQTLKDNPDYVVPQFNYIICQSTFNGILKQGYLVAAKFFISIFSQFSEISLISDLTTQQTQIGNFYNKFDPLQTEHLINTIQYTSKAILTSLSLEKTSYFDSVRLTQIVLFVFEIILLVALFPIFMYPLFNSIRSEMVETVKMISIVQLPYILANSYMLNFLKAR